MTVISANWSETPQCCLTPRKQLQLQGKVEISHRPAMSGFWHMMVSA